MNKNVDNDEIKYGVWINNILSGIGETTQIDYKQQLMDFIQDLKSSNKFDETDAEKLSKIKNLNNVILDIAQYQIQEVDNEINPIYLEYKDKLQNKNAILLSEYDRLLKEREKILEIEEEYKELLSKVNEQQTYNSSINTQFLLLFIIILSFCLIIYVSLQTSSSFVSFSIFNKWYLLILIVFFSTLHLNKPAIFLIWGVLVSYIILWYMNILPGL